MSVDLSFMDLLFDKEDPIIGFDKDINNDALKQLNDKPFNSEDWICPDNFLDSFLQLSNEDPPFEILQNYDVLNNNKVLSEPSHSESSSSSDSGMSSDQQLSPPSSIHEGEFDEIEVKEEIIDVDANCDSLPVLDDSSSSVVECSVSLNDHPTSMLIKGFEEEIKAKANLDHNQFSFSESSKPSPQIQLITTPDSTKNELSVSVMKQKNTLSPKDQNKPVIRAKPIGITNPNRHVLKVTPITSSNPRSILIPVKMKNSNGTSGVRTIKIINTSNRTIPANMIKATKQIPRIITPIVNISEKKVQYSTNSDSDVVSSNDEEQPNTYPPLNLTAEEKRLIAKEGISLPTHYPLTKQEERELKRIRRKIRNKISAQDSRKRKKEYVDGLEERVKQCTEENLTLMNRLKALQTHHQALTAQLNKLQAAYARNSSQTAQPATCLMVLMLSLALVMAPNLRNVRNATNRDLSLPENEVKNPLAGRSRSLLFSKHAPIKLKPSDLTSFQSDDSLDPGIMSDLEELLQFNSKSSVKQPIGKQYDHHYVESRSNRKRTRSYIVPPLDDAWPPPKKAMTVRIKDTIEEKVNKSRLGNEPLEERSNQIVIQLSSDDENDNYMII